MHLAVVLAQLALFSSCTHAFFPYRPSWVEEREESSRGEAKRTAIQRNGEAVTVGITQARRSSDTSSQEQIYREATRLSNKYGGRVDGQTSPSAALTKRGNQYDIMEAADSGNANTAGINQDGTDYSYFIEAELGSSGKKMYMLVDTGAGSSWVMGSSCSGGPCSKHATFGPDDSDTLETSGDDFSVSYGSGKVEGKLATDTIGVAGLSFKYQFGLASKVSDDFSHYAFDGILGLSVSKGANQNFLTTLGEANKLDKNMFCMTINRASDGTNNGEIRFGSTDKDKYSGDITYTPVGKDGDWAVQLDDMGYDGKNAGVGGKLTYIDTGTSYIFGPPDLVKKVHDSIPGAESSDDVSYKVPCDSAKSLTATFSGSDFTISSKDWIAPDEDGDGKCSSNIYGYEVVDGAWLFGDTFLKNVYAVFDKDENQIGFASLAGDNSGGNKASSSSKPSSTKEKSTAKTQTSDSPESTTGSPSTTPGSTTGGSTASGMSTGATTFSTETVSHSANSSFTKPPMGLSGHETHATTGPAATQTNDDTDDEESGASDVPLQNAHFALVLGLVACIMMVS